MLPAPADIVTAPGKSRPCRWLQNGVMAFILHYTYGQDLNENGDFSPGVVGFFHFDKRDYENQYPPRGLPLPAKCQGPAIPTLIRYINEATAAIESWAPQMGTPPERAEEMPLDSALIDISNASGQDVD